MAIVSVLVDQREPQWVRGLDFGGVPTMPTMLDAGDLLVACDDDALLAIERKTAGDFLGSLRDGRLFAQVARLRDLTPWAYLIITGTLHPGPCDKCVTDERETGWTWASVAGALLSIQEVGVHVCQVSSEFDFEASVLRLASRDRSTHRVAPVRDTSIVSDGEAILAALPGIGPERARALLAEFGEPHLAIHYLTVWERHWAHKNVAGIGDGIRRQVRKALGLDDMLYLAAGVFAREWGTEEDE